MAADGRARLSGDRLGLGLHQLRQQFQRQHRALIFLHQRRGLDQRLRDAQPQHVEGDQGAHRHLVVQHEERANRADPDAHAALEAADHGAGTGQLWSSDSILVAASSV